MKKTSPDASLVGENTEGIGTHTLQDFDFLKALTADYQCVFTVNLKTGKGTLFRHGGSHAAVMAGLLDTQGYDQTIRLGIRHHVHPEDQAMVLKKSNLETLKEYFKTNETQIVHFRAVKDNNVHYCYAKYVRIGDAEHFSSFIIGLGVEDERVLKDQELRQNLSLIESDGLTGLYTKEAFRFHARELYRSCPDHPFVFCALKVSDLKTMNRRYGRDKVDELLALVGKRFRPYQNPRSCIAYMGGGLFVCYHEAMERRNRQEMCRQFSEQILSESPLKGFTLKWSVYVGAREDQNPDELVSLTSYAISTIQESEVDYIEFDQSLRERMERKKTIENGFDEALANGEIIVYYQPKIQVGTQMIVGAEALSRWIRPDGSAIPPCEYIPILEHSRMIRKLDEYVFRTVCEMERDLMEKGYRNLPISTNLSRISAYAEMTAERYLAIAKSYGVSPANLPIEITESAAVSEREISYLAQTLVERGFPLEIDDFGAGFSSLASLETLPFDCIKLDRSLTSYIGRPTSEALLRHVIAYARETGKTVVAEGVEDESQYVFLQQCGCDMVQGFYFSKPVDAETFWNLLSQKTIQK